MLCDIIIDDNLQVKWDSVCWSTKTVHTDVPWPDHEASHPLCFPAYNTSRLCRYPLQAGYHLAVHFPSLKIMEKSQSVTLNFLFITPFYIIQHCSSPLRYCKLIINQLLTRNGRHCRQWRVERCSESGMECLLCEGGRA